jgi:hypothetical protein
LEARGGGALCGAGDGLQVPAASSWRQESVGKVGGNGQSTGFGRPLFSAGAMRRGCATGWSGGWFSGGCEVASNGRRWLEVGIYGATLLLLGPRARWAMSLFHNMADSMALPLISSGVQSSALLAVTCRPVASRAWIPPFHPQLKEMRACGSGSRALWTLVPIGRPPLAQ